MNTNTMPGFTAVASLYNGKAGTTGRYRQEANGEQRGELQRTVVIPQVAGPGAPGFATCVSDCADQHPKWTRARCKAACSDPGSTPGSGGGRPPDSAVSALCLGNYFICEATGGDAKLGALCALSFLTGYSGACSCSDLMSKCLAP